MSKADKQRRLDAIEERLARLEALTATPAKPAPISEPLDVHAMADAVAATHSYYSEADDVRSGHSVYL